MSFACSSAAFRNSTGFYFGDEAAPAPKTHRATKSTSSTAGLLSPTKRADADINPYAYAMASIYNRSHPNSRHATPAPSRPTSVHRESAEDKEINPYAYAMGEIYKHSRSRSVTPAQSRAASVHRESADEKSHRNSLSKLWRRSFSRSSSARSSRASSVAPAH